MEGFMVFVVSAGCFQSAKPARGYDLFDLFAQCAQYFGFHDFYWLSAVDFDVFRRVFAFQLAVKINQNFSLLMVNGKAFFHGFFFVVVALNQSSPVTSSLPCDFWAEL